MSGGCYDHAYSRIEELANEITPKTAMRRAFKAHLRDVAKACREIEWNDSGDGADEDAAIMKCLGKDAQDIILSAATNEARRALNELATEISYAELRGKESHESSSKK